MREYSRVLVAGAASLALAAGAITLTTSSAVAQPMGQMGQQQTGHMGKHEAHKAHKHHHKRGRDLLGENIHQDGKHDLEKTASGKTVSAEVKGGKVSAMTADDQPMTKVKSHKKMAMTGAGLALAGFAPELKLAQYDNGDYYGYCYDDGVEVDCYWYDAADVDTSGDWTDYDTWDSGYY